MTTIVTRAGKGSPLTNAEMDQNLINLNTDKAEVSTVVTLTGNQTIAGTKTFSTAIAVSSGGTGQTTAEAAFTAIKQAATTSATGVVELATTAETQTGTDTTRAVTPAGLGASVLGIGQSWQNVAGSRGLGIFYTNSTGRPIVVTVTIEAASTVGVQYFIGGTQFAVTNVLSNLPQTFSFIVPNGITYRVDTSSTIKYWWELR